MQRGDDDYPRLLEFRDALRESLGLKPIVPEPWEENLTEWWPRIPQSVHQNIVEFAATVYGDLPV